MFINNFDPVAFQVLSIEIRWYSLAYIVGLILGWVYCIKILIKDKNKKKEFEDYITYIIIGIIIGGRLGYVFIYNPSYYLKNLNEIFMIWNGGMSFHGALLGIIFATIIFCKKKKSKYFLLFRFSGSELTNWNIFRKNCKLHKFRIIWKRNRYNLVSKIFTN